MSKIYIVKEIHSDNPEPPITYFSNEETANLFLKILNDKFYPLKFISEESDLEIHSILETACKEWGL